jgi:hypothetical protein
MKIYQLLFIGLFFSCSNLTKEKVCGTYVYEDDNIIDSLMLKSGSIYYRKVFAKIKKKKIYDKKSNWIFDIKGSQILLNDFYMISNERFISQNNLGLNYYKEGEYNININIYKGFFNNVYFEIDNIRYCKK